MNDRLFKNYVTTALGATILVFCGVMAYMGKASVEDMAGWMATGVLFLRSKDSLIALPKK
jgi:hypothetical protein